MGIVTLARGRFSLSKRTVVRGAPAYVIGIILTAALPLLLGIGLVIGVAHVAARGAAAPFPLAFQLLDPVAVLLILAVVATIALTSKPRAGQPSTAQDYQNPYSSPQVETASKPSAVVPRPSTPGSPRSDSASAARSSGTARSWYYSVDGKSAQGPVSGAELRRLIANRTIVPDSLVSTDGKTWHEAARLKGAVWPAS